MKFKAFTSLLVLGIISFNIFCFGAKVELIDPNVRIHEPSILVVTPTPFQVDSIGIGFSLKQQSQEISLSYYKVFNKDGNWLVQKIDSLENEGQDQPVLKDWLVYVHGDSQTPELAFTRGFQIQTEYEINVIVYNWPSKNPALNGIQNFSNSRSQIENGAASFAYFFQELTSWKIKTNVEGTSHLSLFLHSLGNYYLERIVSDSLLIKPNSKIFENIILNAAAVNQEDHSLWLKRVDFQERIFVNSNRKDMTLKGVNVFMDFDVQLGEKAIDNFALNSFYVNFGKALRNESSFALQHGYYVGVIPEKSENIYNYYKTIFNGADVNFSDPGKFISNDTVPVYDIVF